MFIFMCVCVYKYCAKAPKVELKLKVYGLSELSESVLAALLNSEARVINNGFGFKKLLNKT